MKKLLLVGVALLAMCGTCYGWGIREHAAVAQIAEMHLTPEAKRLVAEYLDGRPMAYYAYDAEVNRQEMKVEVVTKSSAQRVAMPRTFCVNGAMKPSRKVEDKQGNVTENLLCHIEQLALNLKANHRTMEDSVRVAHLALLIHAVGDMHCPIHVGYEDNCLFGEYKVYFGKGKSKKEFVYSKIWNGKMIGAIHQWSYREMGELFDIYTEPEIAKFCKGDVYAWGKDVATISRPIHAYGEDCRIEEVDYRHRFQQMGEELMTKAGYRLAKLLNDILK